MYNQYKAHPWHGIDTGGDAPMVVNAFIEIVPSDTVKYEIDKQSGYLKVDRPQKFSNAIPTLYGFIPQTYCGSTIAEFASQQSGKTIANGDKDPLDICVLSERNMMHGNVILEAVPIGGFRLIDRGDADDKIIAVMKGDEFHEQWQDITHCPESYINRLKHYFLTYKNLPGEKNTCEIANVYGREEAHEVIRCSMADYATLIGQKNPIDAVADAPVNILAGV